MLGASSPTSDSQTPDIAAATRGTGEGTGVPHGDALVRFVNATLTGTDEDLAAARTALVDAVGEAGMHDAAGVIGNFTLMNRVADGTGLPLDAPLELASRGLRDAIGVNAYSAAERTRVGGFFSRIAAWVLARLLPIVLRLRSRG